MKFASTLIAILPMVTITLAATITVMGVQNPNVQAVTGLPTLSETIYPIGTGTQGETTYAVDAVQSVVAYVVLSQGTVDGVSISIPFTSTKTLDDPITIHETIVADATHLAYHYDPPTPTNIVQIEVNEDCVLNGATGSCVEKEVIVFGPSGPTSTQTTTYTGSIIPIFTVVEANGSAHRFRLLYETSVGLGIVVIGMLSAWFLVL